MELVKSKAQASDLQVFNCELGSVRAILENGEPLFCLADLVHSLELTNPVTVKDSINVEFDKGGKFNLYPLDTKGGKQNFTFINESELYFVIMRSKSNKAKPFRQWVCNEVLPSLRKNIVVAGKDKYLPQCRENCLQTFAYNGGDLDYGLLNGEPIFNLLSICKMLNISNPHTSIDTKDEDYVIMVSNSKLGFTYFRNLANRGELFLTEAGLYRLLLRSNKAEAERFSKWVTKEVLPSLRKNGGYIANQENMTPEQILANALIVAQNIIADRDKTIAEQKQVIEYQGGKLDNFTSVEKARRSKQELSTKLNKTIRLLAEQKFDKDYGKAYTYIYGEFAKLHCISDKVNMDYLKKNIGYLAECLAIATTELE